MRAIYEDLSNGIYKSEKFLINFLSNLLLGEKHSLKNREMHIRFSDSVNAQNDTVNDTVLDLIKQNGKIIRVGSDKTGSWKII